MVDDLHDLDVAERGSESPKGCVLIGSTVTGQLSLRWVVPSDAEVEVDPASLPLDLVDLAFAVFLAVMLAVVPGLGAGRLAPAGRVTPVLAGRLGGVPCG